MMTSRIAAGTSKRSLLEKEGYRYHVEQPSAQLRTEYDEDRVAAARHLWGCRSKDTSMVERYLAARGYRGPLPASISFLPPDTYAHPAMIAKFGFGDDVCGVHLTFLNEAGTDKADVRPQKIMLGKFIGWPIVLAEPNDLLGLCISEGIETALSAHMATGLGAWAAGSATFLPYLADAVRGGGALIAELDGNLTAIAKNEIVEMSWAGKFRGPHFDPISFEIDCVTSERLKDSRGKSVWTAIARPIGSKRQAEIEDEVRSNEDQVLLVLDQSPDFSMAEIARSLNWISETVVNERGEKEPLGKGAARAGRIERGEDGRYDEGKVGPDRQGQKGRESLEKPGFLGETVSPYRRIRPYPSKRPIRIHS
jgi:hypothetical protein